MQTMIIPNLRPKSIHCNMQSTIPFNKCLSGYIEILTSLPDNI